MKVLVAYASEHGSTRGIAERIGQTLEREGISVTVAPVEAIDRVDASFDAFVVGSAVHVGHWLKPATEFVQRITPILATRPTWLFSSGPIGEKHVHEPQPDPKEVEAIRGVIRPRDHVVFAGAFDRAVADRKGGFLDRAVNRFIPEGDFRDWPAIESWATGIAAQLLREPVEV